MFLKVILNFGHHISLLCRQPFCQLCRKVILRLSEHGDVIIETQSAWLLICHFDSLWNSLWLLLVKKIWQTCFRHGAITAQM